MKSERKVGEPHDSEEVNPEETGDQPEVIPNDKPADPA